MNWQPIATAPRDGTHVLLHVEDGVIEGWWDGNYISDSWQVVSMGPHGCGCCATYLAEPVAWMPLPEPPRALGE